MNNKTIVLNLKDCNDLNELHKRIKNAFSFPDFYGENWDAFWDLLHTERSFEKVIIQGTYTVCEKLVPQLEIFYKILQRNQGEAALHGWDFNYEIID